MEDLKLTQLQAMEGRYERLLPRFKALNDELGAFQEVYQDYIFLRDYYGSEEWWQFQDELPPDYKCGVLSQDRLYNLIQDHDELIANLLDLSHRMYRNR